MNGKLKVLLFLVLSGLWLGISPGIRLYSADETPECECNGDPIESASVQFLLVHIEREMLEEHMDESNVLTIDSISLETIGRCMQEEEGAEIISQTKLTVVNGIEAEMTIVENEASNAKNADERNDERKQNEAEVFVWLEPEILDGNKLAARFTYKRSVAEKGFFASEEAVEEEGNKQKIEIASGIVLQGGKACIAGANLTEDIATLLVMKADLK